MKKLVSFILSLVFVFSVFFTIPTNVNAASASDNQIISLNISGKENYNYAFDVLNKLNALRGSLKLGALKMDASLMSSAMQRAAEISIYFSHTRPNGYSCFSVFDDVLLYYSMGENIAMGQSNPADVMESWTNSSGHYENMVKSSYKSVGIGCFEMSNGMLCWVQLFSGCNSSGTSKSGIVNANYDIEALKENLSLSFNTKKDIHNFKKGESTSIEVLNTNKGWNYGKQLINNSSFKFVSNNNVLSVDNTGKCTVNSEGIGKITVTHIRDSGFGGTAEYTIGHIFSDNSDVYCNICNTYCPSGNTIVIENDGGWYHYINRKRVYDTTLVYYADDWDYIKGWYYVKNGKVDFNANTLVFHNYKWWYVRNGKVDFDANTLVYYNNHYWYVRNGKVDFDAKTLVFYNHKWWYVNEGKVDFSATTLVRYNNQWWYVNKGKVDFNANTLVFYNYKWWYVNKGKVDFNATTLTRYNNQWLYVNKGKVDFNANTLVFYNYKWWYVKKGKVDFTATTLVRYNNQWWYVKNGKVDFDANTLTYYNKQWFHVKGGKWVKDNTLVYYNGKWWYVNGGIVNFSYTGKVLYGGRWYNVRNGVKI